jgi:hypothetical protein
VKKYKRVQALVEKLFPTVNDQLRNLSFDEKLEFFERLEDRVCDAHCGQKLYYPEGEGYLSLDSRFGPIEAKLIRTLGAKDAEDDGRVSESIVLSSLWPEEFDCRLDLKLRRRLSVIVGRLNDKFKQLGENWEIVRSRETDYSAVLYLARKKQLRR